MHHLSSQPFIRIATEDMIPKAVIEKAFEGGWRHFEHSAGLAAHNVLAVSYWQIIALDPSFWQALGKALNWGRHLNWCRWETVECEYKSTHLFCPHAEHGCTCRSSITWQHRAESFCHIVLTDQPTEQFWEELLAEKKI